MSIRAWSIALMFVGAAASWQTSQNQATRGQRRRHWRRSKGGWGGGKCTPRRALCVIEQSKHQLPTKPAARTCILRCATAVGVRDMAAACCQPRGRTPIATQERLELSTGRELQRSAPAKCSGSKAGFWWE